MKKIITILVSCSLALAASAMAQQEEAQPTPRKKQQRKAHATSAAQLPAGQPTAKPQAGGKAREGAAAAPKANAQAPMGEAPSATPNARPNAAGQGKKGRKGESTTPPQPAAPLAPQPNNAQANNKGAGKAKKPADVQKIKAQHASFHAQPKPQQVPAVTFSQSRQISGSEQWQGQKYTAFRSYRPARHDQAWYRSHYTRVVLIAGGYYYLNAGYWYPAWGYLPSAEYVRLRWTYLCRQPG